MSKRRHHTQLSRFIVGDLQVHPDRGCAVRNGVDIPLEPRPIQVLEALARKAGDAVTSTQLQLEIWKTDPEIYDDNAVTKALSVLRKALGDDARNPRYIEMLTGRGYRLIQPVSFPNDYRGLSKQTDPWKGGSPFVGLAAFETTHAKVFAGRTHSTGDVLDAMRRQIDNSRRFVLIAGSSGCGKTSLLRAGVLPKLTESGGFGGLRALSVATCDLAATLNGDAMLPLANALAGWKLHDGVEDRPVFAAQPIESLKHQLTETPIMIAPAIAEAFRRFKERKLDTQPHAHLLLVIDHAEALVRAVRDPTERDAFERVLCALCDTPRALVVMIVRADYAPNLAQTLPTLNERKTGGGHLDLLAPNRGEIAEMIRTPAWQAGLDFDVDEERQRLDDALRDAASGQSDALPLLQHTLQLLYEDRTKNGILTWDAYRRIGELGGAIAHRAEEVFLSLPVDAQASLDAVLAQLIVIHSDSDAVTARRAPLELLQESARTLVDGFVVGRLFVIKLHDGRPHFGVVHEALLRQWPRAVEWVQENRRLLMAKARLQRAAKRWNEEGRSADHLLNAGRPLEESTEAALRFSSNMTPVEREFLQASENIFLRKKRKRIASLFSLAALTIASSIMAIALLIALDNSKRSGLQSQHFSDLVFDIADDLQKTGDGKSLEDISESTLSALIESAKSGNDHNDLINRSRALALKGSVLLNQGKNKEAFIAFNDAYGSAKKAVSLSDGSDRARAQYGQSSYWLGHYFYDEGEYDKAKKYWGNYRHQYKMLREKNRNEYKSTIELSYAYDNLGSLAEVKGIPNQSLAYFANSLALKKEISIKRAGDKELAFETIVTQSKCANALVSIGELEKANTLYSSTIKDLKILADSNESANEWKKQLSNLLQIKSRLSVIIGNMEDAENEIISSIYYLSEIRKDNINHADWRQYLIMSHYDAAEIYRLKQKNKRALYHLAQAESLLDSIPSKEGMSFSLRRTLANMRVTRALIEMNQAQSNAMDAGISELRALYKNRPEDIHTVVSLARALIAKGLRYPEKKDSVDANTYWREAELILSNAAKRRKDPRILGVLTVLGDRLGKYHEYRATRSWLSKIGYRHPELLLTADINDSRLPR